LTEKINKIENQTKEIHTKTNYIEKKVDRIDQLLEEQKIEIEVINSTTKRIEKKIESVENQTKEIHTKTNNIDKKVDKIDQLLEEQKN